ncbi:MAG: DUF2818 family protein [Gammaproteobacteria bacterium]|nr:MAG: DUF2818 family protein [Gammaproteobacteria bacterium]
MSASLPVWVLLILALIAANLPWLSERILFVYPPKSGVKPVWIRLLEWLLMYFVVGLIALGLEQKLHGQPHSQDWEFYAVNLFLFLVFALPGFIYRYDLKSLLDK